MSQMSSCPSHHYVSKVCRLTCFVADMEMAEFQHTLKSHNLTASGQLSMHVEVYGLMLLQQMYLRHFELLSLRHVELLAYDTNGAFLVSMPSGDLPATGPDCTPP